MTWFWELLPRVWTEISAGRGCREELNITKCYIFYVLTIALTEIPILQSPGRQIDDFREGWFLQKGSWRAGPPDRAVKTTRSGPRMAATRLRSTIMTEYGIVRDARQCFFMYVMLNSYIPKRDRNHACKKFFFQRSSYCGRSVRRMLPRESPKCIRSTELANTTIVTCAKLQVFKIM